MYSNLSNKQGVLLIVFGIFSQPPHLGNYFAIYDYLYILLFLHLSTTLLGYKSDERLQNHDHILCKFSDILHRILNWLHHIHTSKKGQISPRRLKSNLLAYLTRSIFN